MKILKRKNNNLFPMQITCKSIADQYGFVNGKKEDYCGSELEIDPEDIKKHKWFKFPDYEGTDYGVICPVCNQFITIDSNSLPQYVKDNAEEILFSNLPTAKKEIKKINMQGLDEGIRCALCTNFMKSDTGCDGGCSVDDHMVLKVMEAIEKQIVK